MRITCPNCGAQYEVDAALIPEAGRDVQCSNCGKGWFQKPMDEATGAVPAGKPVDEAEPEDVRAQEEAEAAEPEAEVEPEPEPEPEPGPEPEPEPEPQRPPVPERRHDPSALAILREEAERELRARRGEAEAEADMQSQPDLGLSEAPPPKKRPKSEPALTAATRRDSLPDIDEINSTLAAEADRQPMIDDTPPEADIARQRRGFRIGFSSMLLLAALLIVLYSYAGNIAAAVPALEPAVIAYVDAANVLRDWIDGLLARGVGEG